MATNFTDKSISSIQLKDEKYHIKSVPFHATEEEWNSTLASYVPKQAEIVVYDADENFDLQRIKIGDGTTPVGNLEFAGGAQSDWNASEGEPGHVLNRTHWVEDTRVTVLSSVVDYNDNGAGFIATPFELVIGEEYTVEFGNIKFTATAINGKEISGTFSGCGALVNSEKDFLVIDTSKNSGYDNLGIYGVVDTPEGERASFIKICQGDLKIHKLDTKFLPDGVPYCIDGGRVKILSDADVSRGDDDGDGIVDTLLINTELDLVAGETYIVNWDGTEYSCVAVDLSALSGISPCIALGDVYTMSDGEIGDASTGEPFAIMYAPTMDVDAGITGMAGSLSGDLPNIVEIYKDDIAIRKLDNRCLDLEWLPVIDKAYLIPEQTVSAVDITPDGKYMAVVKINPEWDGGFSVNEKTPLTISFQGIDFPAFGGGTMDGDFIAPEAEDFYFAGFNDSWGIIVPSPGTYTISVSDPAQSAYNRIPEEFLPDSTATKEYVDEAIATITMTEATSVVIKSSTPGSTKKFKITVDDTGTLTVTEI